MMHRHVTLIARTGDPALFEILRGRVGARLGKWRTILDTEIAQTWILVASPSQLGGRSNGASGCVVGLDFPGNENGASSDCGKDEGGTSRSDRWGAYVEITVDRGRREVTIRRDPSGRIECWCLSLDGVDVLFSHYEDVCWLQARALTLNWDYLRYHLHNDWNHGEETGYVEVRELLAGQTWVYRRGAIQKQMWWRPDLIAGDSFGSIEEAQAAIRAAAEMAVGAWGRKYQRIALNLSGGLDSAIILGLLRQYAPATSVVGVNYVIPDTEGDERAYARDAAKLHGIELIEQEISVENAGVAPSSSRRLFRPAMRSLSLGYDRIGGEITTRIGADAFFTGEGGDHLFCDHLKIDAVCDYYRAGGNLPDLVRMSHRLAQVSKNTIWAGLSAIAADRFGRAPSLKDHIRVPNPFLSPEGQKDPDFLRFVHPWLVDAHHTNTPPAKLQQTMNMIELRRHYVRYGRADLAEEVHPFISEPLMVASLRTPTYWFCVGGIQRGLVRRAVADLLPPSILARRTKSFNTSHWLQMMERDLPETREQLMNGSLAAQGLLDRDELASTLTPLGLASTRANAPLVTCLTTEMWIQQAMQDQQSFADIIGSRQIWRGVVA